MCFSAGASFGAGAVLAVVGVVSVKKAQSRRELPFASIPLIFAVQQIAEGCLWLALSDPAYAWMQQLATYTFLFFAQFLWPVWVPMAVLLYEKREERKKLLWVLVGIGAVVSVNLAYCMLNFHVEASIAEYHINYKLNFPPMLNKYGGLLYIIATIVSPLISGARRMWVLGVAIFISYLITMFFYRDYVVSVWCFFAAVISILVYFIVRWNVKTKPFVAKRQNGFT